MITIVYLTSRRDPHYNWFVDSLTRQASQDFAWIKLVVVDFFAEEPGRSDVIYAPSGLKDFVHCTPKPNVWQGKYRLTKQDYFAASNARNTGLCHSKDGTVVFTDDLSVLLPGWYAAVKEAAAKRYVMSGAYKKMLELRVEEGLVASYKDFPPGVDCRWNQGNDNGPIPATPGWMFGCTLVAPVEGMLAINGFDEDCDSLGAEDYVAGYMLQQAGYSLMYDRRAATYESEEGHHTGNVLKRIDKGVSPNDKSHKMLYFIEKGGRTRAPNYFGEEGVRGLRKRVLAGGAFPIQQIPQHDWYDGQPLSEM